ncbi:sel1 repeat family protein [Helicobacter bizzozeronii]|uniref:sel1 repeat family protein n=1 Tax=Helicobacter bizzozeronii TaxID=56877 RepID=UPI000CF0AB91|nr:sel1 repeat family protein [Helicobacter bizzozeronii]
MGVDGHKSSPKKWLKWILVFLVVVWGVLEAVRIIANLANPAVRVKEEISPLMQSGIDSAREKRYQEALNIFKEGYKKGDNFGAALIGFMYFHGQGVKKNLCVAKPYFQLVLNKQGLQNQDIATIIAKAYLAGAYIGGLCVKQSYDKAEKLLADVLNANGALVVGHGKNLQVDLDGLRAKNFAQYPLKRYWLGMAIGVMGTYLEVYPKFSNPKSTLLIARSCYQKALEFGYSRAKVDLERVQEKLH